MLKIRLQRVGRKNDPAFRVVVTEHTNSTKSGRYLEVLGSYDPRKSTEHFDASRIKEWMSKGATLSDTLHNLFISKKIIDGKKINVLPKKSPVIDEEKVAAEKAAAEAAEKAKADAEAAAAQALADNEAEAAAPEVVAEAPAPEVVAPSTTTDVVEEDKETPAPAETPEEKPAE